MPNMTSSKRNINPPKSTLLNKIYLNMNSCSSVDQCFYGAGVPVGGGGVDPGGRAGRSQQAY